MSDTVLLCADGSELSTEALRAGVELLGPEADYLLITVVDAVDPMLVTGSGFAGGTMTPEELGELEHARIDEGRQVLVATARALGLSDVRMQVVVGGAGTAIVRLAAELGVRAIVLGSRGRGGLKRALLGSVSDHVVRHAACPVVVTGGGEPEDG